MSLRFGLGALLVATALFASVFAWFAAHARQSTVEDKALAALDELNDAGRIIVAGDYCATGVVGRVDYAATLPTWLPYAGS